MSKEKQKIISDICPFYKEYGTCEQCNKDLDIDDPPCYFECMANAIINNGYRKQSEGEWLEINDGVLIGDGKHLECSKCGVWKKDKQKSNFCSNCGAKMKGGAE